MIKITQVKVKGQAGSKYFSGNITFNKELEIIVAKNGYGKSLINSSIIWGLGLEPLYVNRANDSSMLQEALRTRIELETATEYDVASCIVELTIENEKGEILKISRSTDPELAGLPEVMIKLQDGTEKSSKLKMGLGTKADGAAGFQNIFENFASLSFSKLLTYQGRETPIYFENLAPLFFIDQLEGWSNVQSQQITRYGLLQVEEGAVESLLGLKDRLRRRLLLQKSENLKSKLRSELSEILKKINSIVEGTGNSDKISAGNKKISDLVEEYTSFSLQEYLKDTINWNYDGEKKSLLQTIKSLKERLIDPATPNEKKAHTKESSTKVIALRNELHQKRDELTTLNFQLRSQDELLKTFEERERSASDLLKLKRDGIGFPSHLSCPTCQNSIQPENFNLISQDVESVEVYISSLKREREVVKDTIGKVRQEVVQTTKWISDAQVELKADERKLETINSSITANQQELVAIVAKLSETERKKEKLDKLNEDIIELQTALNAWVTEAEEVGKAEVEGLGPRPKVVDLFESLFREYLFKLRHSALKQDGVDTRVRIDERYVPMFENRRLRTLGSASDQARLVLAYTSALLVASKSESQSNHPGFIIYDEPFQQNPDDEHEKHLIEFFKYASKNIPAQIIISTFLPPTETAKLKSEGLHVKELSGEHFLKVTDSKK